MAGPVGIIVAVSPEGVIGVGGKIPWQHRGDLARFKRLTSGGTVIMGRLTWDSLPKRPLPDRRNIVITKTPIEGVDCFPDIPTALRSVTGPAWFIGGARVYEEALRYADFIDMTYVPDVISDPDAIYFPGTDPNHWIPGELMQHEDEPGLTRRTFTRKSTVWRGISSPKLLTERLALVPTTLALVEAVVREDRAMVELLAGAKLPATWPGVALIERAFSASLDRIRADPGARLWGDRLIIQRGESRVIVGSVVFHGEPNEDGVVEVGYGVEGGSHGKGYATEAVAASIEWALTQPFVKAVQATTTPWHQASIRVLEKVGMTRKETREHDILGELLVFERRK